MTMNGAGTFGAGVPESAEFCDGPGPGMALEQNSFPAATSPGLGRRWFEGLTELLNIIIAKLYNEPPRAACLYNLYYVMARIFKHLRRFEGLLPGVILLPGEAGRG